MPRLLARSAGLAGLFIVAAGLLAQPAPDDRAALIDGVKEIAVPGLPGTVVPFGEQAFPVVAAKANGEPAVVVAAGRLGKGRVVAFGHEGYLAADALKKADTQRLVENAVRWAAGRDKAAVAVVGLPETAKFLPAAVLVPRGKGWVAKATAAPVVVVNAGDIGPDDVAALRRFVETGGGLVTGMPGWGWEQLNPGKSLAKDNAAQKLLGAAGLAFASDTITAEKGKLAIGDVPPTVHVRDALVVTEAALAGKDADPAATRTAQATVIRALAALTPEDAGPVLDRVQAVGKNAPAAFPTEKQPIRKKDAAGRLAVGLRNRLALMLPPEQVQAAPGAVAVPKDAPRATKKVSVTTGVAGYVCDGVGTSAKSDLWTSTGLYAAPGEVVTVAVPAEVVGKGVQIQIGCHSDTLWHLDSWERYPEVVRRFPVTQEKTTAASAFGGLVYVTTPINAKLGTFDVTVANAVPAPLYVHGKTTKDEWTQIRNAPGPWAEFASDKVILTVPSDLARRVADPVELMTFWDEVLDACADLSAVERRRGRAERLVHDVQISAGYMHSGYPIMGPINEGERALDVARIRRDGAWGYFHELGHNHQGPPWTFDGTVEVTCNLYSLYVTQTLCPRAPLHDEIQPAAIRRNAGKYKAGGAAFETWKKEPFWALILYKQMIDEFGWETFKKVFAEYRALPANQRPRGDEAKRDQWLTRFSKAAGKNLAPAFEYWGIPVSDAARKAVAGLPTWAFPDATK